jgi:hypothetical protein
MHNEVYKALIRDGLYLRAQAGSHQRYRHPDASVTKIRGGLVDHAAHCSAWLSNPSGIGAELP